MSRRTENYIDDLPMAVSRRFQPKEFAVLNEPLPQLPADRSPLESFYQYDFEVEQEAIEMGNRYEQEALAEEERVRVRRHEVEQLFRQKALERVEAILRPAGLVPSSRNSPVEQLRDSDNELSESGPTPPQSTTPLTASLEQSLPSTAASMSTIDQQQQQNHQQDPLPEPIMLRPMMALPHSNSNHNSILQPISSNPLAPSTNRDAGGTTDLKPTPVVLSTLVSSAGSTDLRNCDKNGQAKAKQHNFSIDPRDFEGLSGSSPFDDAMLRAIDEKEELSSVFRNVFLNGSQGPETVPPPASNGNKD